MTKIVRAKYKASRRLGKSLWGRAKDPVNKKNYPPGQHGALGYKKGTSFGVQLSAKQQLKKHYGTITEKQFRAIYKEATRLKGDPSENLVGLLERLLVAVVYRANFAATIFAARQLVSHKHILVNGKVVNIPSYRVKAGDVIELKKSSQQIVPVLEATQTKEREVPEYITVDFKAFKATYNHIPKLADIPYPIVMEPNLVIEFYSR